MFTVRVIYPNHVERIIPALEVTKLFIASENTSDKQEIVSVEISENNFERFDEGALYVMNDKGATVAKYILGERRNEKTGNKNNKAPG